MGKPGYPVSYWKPKGISAIYFPASQASNLTIEQGSLPFLYDISRIAVWHLYNILELNQVSYLQLQLHSFYPCVTCAHEIKIIITYYNLQHFRHLTSSRGICRNLAYSLLLVGRPCWFNFWFWTRAVVMLYIFESTDFARFAPNPKTCFLYVKIGVLVCWPWNLVCVSLVRRAKKMGGGRHVCACWALSEPTWKSRPSCDMNIEQSSHNFKS